MSNDNVGKRRGAPKGRRPVIYVCAAIVDGSLKCDEIPVHDQDPNSVNGSFPQNAAVSQFKDTYGVEPERVLGPLFEKKGLKKVTANKKKLVLDRDNIDNYTLSEEHTRARYGDWSGFANLCMNNSEKAFFIPINRVNADDSKKSNPPGAGIVNVSDLVFENEMLNIDRTA